MTYVHEAMERATIKMFIDQCNALDIPGAADCIENLAAEVERLRRQINPAPRQIEPDSQADLEAKHG